MSDILRVVLRPFWNARQRRVRALWRFAIFMALLVGAELVLSWLGPRGTELDAFMLRSMVNFLLTAILAAGCTLLLDRRGFDALGWVPSRRWWTDLAFGACLGGALISGVVAIERTVGWLTPVARPEGALIPFLLKALVLFVAAGAAEEFVFRSYMLRNLADGLKHRRVGPGLALVGGTVLSSALFGLIHYFNPNATAASVANIALAGVFLAAGYVLTGRLALPLGLHVAWNFFQGPVFGLPVSGFDLGRSLFAVKQGGPEVWTGGPFGIEGGLLGLFAMLVGVMATGVWVQWREGALLPAENLLFPDTPPVTPTLSEPPAEGTLALPTSPPA